MIIDKGTKRVNKGRLLSIADIKCANNYTIYVFPGTISPNDILLKYTSPRNKRLRTPRHIHWAVDLLMKKSKNSTLTSQFLNSAVSHYNECPFLTDNSYADIEKVVRNATSKYNSGSFSKLDAYGEYPTEFLFILMCLLAVQEKTNAILNNQEAHMFVDILNELSAKKIEIYKVVSTATFKRIKQLKT